jgi:nucleotide-binding universal stress UspA family protein
MHPKTIALVILGRDEADWIIPSACRLAACLDAHLTAIYPYTPFAMYGDIVVDPSIYVAVQDTQKEDSDVVEALFAESVRKHDIRGEFRGQDTRFSAERYLLSSTRSSDLAVIASGPIGGLMPDDRQVAEQLIRRCGRPVLVLPKESDFSGPAERILIGWSDTREAARAAHDVLALAAPDATVDLLAVSGPETEPAPGLDTREDLAAALDRRGFRVTVTDRAAPAAERGEALLTAAREWGADLVATGAFGHSAVYDFVIGAVTSHLLANAKVPVLVSK